jgi:amino acid transporter
LGGDAEEDQKFGAFAGVYTPTILTILGVIMYLRHGQVVGNAGLLGAIVIVLLAHIITITTGLSVSSMATNTRVGAGGAFAIISQSLGVEVGGSIGVPLFLAQAVSVAMYVVGFAEAWQIIFAGHSFALVSILTFALVCAIAFISIRFAARIQFIILGIVAFSLLSIFLGSFPIAAHTGLIEEPQIWGTFPRWDFWRAFTIFFPAVTGIMTGISLSGTLREPRKSLPTGTMGAVATGLVVYVLLAYWLSRAATPQDLADPNNRVLVERALFGWAVLAGMLAATFSSALGTLIAAPQVMQALAAHRVMPLGHVFARETPSGEPRQAMMATVVVSFLALVFSIVGGGLDAIAPVITMFFLLTYSMLNVVVLVEQRLDMVSFRPTFSIPPVIPFVGAVFCIFVMFLVSPTFGLVAIGLVVALYAYLARRELVATSSDVRSGLFMAVAEWAATRIGSVPEAPERRWKPSVLVPVDTTGVLAGSYRFLCAMTAPQGRVHILGLSSPDDDEALKDLDILVEAFANDGIYARRTILEAGDYVEGVRTATQVLGSTFFRPNILFLRLHRDSDLQELQRLVDRTAAYRMGIVLLARHPVIELGRERLLNVWVSPQGPEWEPDLHLSNMDLALLLAYKLRRNWDGQINLCMAVPDAETRAKAEAFLDELVTLARLPAETRVMVWEAPLEEALRRAPRADLSSFGLPREPDLAFSQRIVELVDGSCIFVRDSGDESVLA